MRDGKDGAVLELLSDGSVDDFLRFSIHSVYGLVKDENLCIFSE